VANKAGEPNRAIRASAADKANEANVAVAADVWKTADEPNMTTAVNKAGKAKSNTASLATKAMDATVIEADKVNFVN
jgi:hypothetical protein